VNLASFAPILNLERISPLEHLGHVQPVVRHLEVWSENAVLGSSGWMVGNFEVGLKTGLWVITPEMSTSV
jgi:hypothetical protein